MITALEMKVKLDLQNEMNTFSASFLCTLELDTSKVEESIQGGLENLLLRSQAQKEILFGCNSDNRTFTTIIMPSQEYSHCYNQSDRSISKF